MEIGEGVSTPVASSDKSGKVTCTILSSTVATSPAKRDRKRIGVGEEVDLTVKPGPATWEIQQGGGNLSPTFGTSVTYTAGDASATVIIAAKGPDCTCTITFNVVEPSGWTMKRKPGTNVRHKSGRPHCGWQGIFFIHPNNVNFYNIKFRELDSQYNGTGSYLSYNGAYHGNYPLPERASPWLPVTTHTDADGSQPAGVDNVDTGDPGSAITGSSPPFKVGAGYFPITMQWQVGAGSPKSFTVSRQEDEIFASGKCESRKGGHIESTLYNDP